MTEPTNSYGVVDRDYATKLATTAPDDDGPVWMLNLMKYREVAEYAEGAGSTEPVSGRAADNLYNPIDILESLGAQVVFVADVEQQLLGDETVWDRVAIVKYPTRRSFIDMQAREDFQKKKVHKDAGMERTFVMGCQPMDLPSMPDDDGVEVLHPPTEEDGRVVVLHVLRFHDVEEAASTPEHMEQYQAAASTAARRNGVHIPGWFAVEGTIMGDGRQWHQARFNGFSSLRGFMDVVGDPERLAAQAEHREAAIADTYTMILRPRLDHIAESIAAG